MSEQFERCKIWAMFISAGPPLLSAELMRTTSFTPSLIIHINKQQKVHLLSKRYKQIQGPSLGISVT